ncbi:MAG: class I SAM-dependent methyltransferase [Firmicutes bacterium]|jgi:SAM-dependent methyltransferase|nr:class I SAM-dependent methyltransferase [Bacillota bacterium]
MSKPSNAFRAHPHFSRLYLRGGPVLNLFLGQAREAQGRLVTGKTLIIGAGSGLDVPAVLPFAKTLTLLEPDPTFASHLLRQYPQLPVLITPAEFITAADNTFDTVLSSLVLCSVADLSQTLKEIFRVLKPDGQFLFLEHGIHRNKLAARMQAALDPAWQRVGGGCHLTRPIVDAVAAQGLVIDQFQYISTNWLVPLITGRATKSPIHRQTLRETPR